MANCLPSARCEAERLDLKDRVIFEGRLPREEVLARYLEFDVFLFPSLHDTGGYAVIESMFNKLPVICLNSGGPAVAVDRSCRIRVPLGSRSEITTRLATAIRFYDKDRAAILNDGQRARQRILECYDWEQKGIQMQQLQRSFGIAWRAGASGGVNYASPFSSLL
jgi:glycosyltransferase involved in cell wall biosynthesis